MAGVKLLSAVLDPTEYSEGEGGRGTAAVLMRGRVAFEDRDGVVGSQKGVVMTQVQACSVCTADKARIHPSGPGSVSKSLRPTVKSGRLPQPQQPPVAKESGWRQGPAKVQDKSSGLGVRF